MKLDFKNCAFEEPQTLWGQQLTGKVNKQEHLVFENVCLNFQSVQLVSAQLTGDRCFLLWSSTKQRVTSEEKGMPQTFHVLVCVECKTFQVHIVKKSSNKWNCKICNTKQSVLQVYAKGTGAECREVVQKLNQARGQLEENQKLNELSVAQAQQHQQQEAAAYERFTDAGEEAFCEEAYHTITAKNESSSVGTSNTTCHQPGILSVPLQQSKWRIFLEQDS
ncbi:unnamed protein product [Orchesella dallaii]|uniref:MRN complex-interacting protein N-terminal domain-containing protein n=1 Tax=Orchesella dallaii TaxID=48710 RepID=A0ABP1R0H7_9HEXA